MPKEKSVPSEFIVTLPIKNEHGVVVGEKQFVIYAGLLALAHEIGLDQIHATIIQLPTESNGMTAIVRAVVQGKRGTYSGLGDASPQSVNRKVARHLIRVAETRAKARALRDFTNVALVAVEELGDQEHDATDPRASPHIVPLAAVTQPAPARRTMCITDAQRRALWRKAMALGYEGDAAQAFLAKRLGVPPERASKEQASRLLDDLAAAERANEEGDAAG